MANDWNKRLKQGYREKFREGEKQRSVRLPATGISFSDDDDGDPDHAVVTLSQDALFSNMQTNAGAFEGWCLALKRWCGASKVTLKWEPLAVPLPYESMMTRERKSEWVRYRHYQRFLYRVKRFRSLFDDWFEIGVPSPFENLMLDEGQPAYLNVAGDRVDAEADSQSSMSKTTSSPEYALERSLCRDETFKTIFGFPDGVVDFQFPVGIFSTQKPAVSSAIFPGGKGAIDLVCMDKRHLWLFELKAKDNISVGTLSELLFYSSVVRDVARKKIGIAAGVRKEGKVNATDVADVEAITVVMLGHKLHPLLADVEMLAIINAALESRWNAGPRVRIEAGVIQADVGNPKLKINFYR